MRRCTETEIDLVRRKEFDCTKRRSMRRYFNDNEIKSNQRTRVDTKGPASTLTINKADMPDVGVYKVVADNGKEKIETVANVDVCGELF